MDYFEERRRAPEGSTLDATYNIPLSTLGPTRLKDEQTALTMQAHGTYGAVKPAAFAVWEVEEGMLKIPRFTGCTATAFPKPTIGHRATPSPRPSSGHALGGADGGKRAVTHKYLHPKRCGGTMICLPCGYEEDGPVRQPRVHARAQGGRRRAQGGHPRPVDRALPRVCAGPARRRGAGRRAVGD